MAQEALPDCEKAVLLAPNDAQALRSKAYILLKLRRYNDAMSDYDASLRFDPMNADALFGRGSARTALGNASAGSADIEAAKAIDSEIAERFDDQTRTFLRSEFKPRGPLPLF